MHEIAELHVLERILENNNELAQHNRQHFDQLGLTAFNFMSAPGAGKTTLLGELLQQLSGRYRCRVIEGDMVGSLDADRLRQLGVSVTQISTGRSCHLDAQMVARVLHCENLCDTQLLFIENVGNLVCPAEFPLGEHKRVVLLSVSEGDDKPLKYPVIFRNCDAVVFTKCDLLPYVQFSIAAATEAVSALNGNAAFFQVSCVSGEGVRSLSEWLAALSAAKSSMQNAI